MRALAAALVVFIVLMSGRILASGESWHPAAVDHIDKPFHVLVFTDAAGRQYVRHLDVTQLELPVAGGPRYKHAGEWYFHVDDLPFHEVRVDDIGNRVHFVHRTRTHIEAPPSEHLLFDVTVNGRAIDEPLLMRYANGEIVLSESALAALGINEQKARILLKDDDNLPLHAIAGEQFAMDHSALTLVMTVPPELFLPVRVGVHRQAERSPPASGMSAMLGYDITAGIDHDGNRWHAGLYEFAIGGPTQTCLSQHARLRNSEIFHRLDSRCMFDWPQRMLSVRVGDGITQPGGFGQAVRYGGVRVGTDFGLAPDLVTQPTLALLGSARVPSTLEVWVDRMLALRQEIQPGVFELEDIPVHTGAGEVRAVVTNVLGVREIISRPFYSDPSLLASGLAHWSLEFGRLRENYLLETDGYGERFGMFGLRYGVFDWLTMEPRFEMTNDFQLAALGATLRIGNLGVLAISHASSRAADDAEGAANELKFSRRGRRVSLNISHARSDEHFVQLGYPEPGTTPAQRSQATLGFNVGGGVSVSLGGFERVRHDQHRQRFHTLAVNARIGRFAHLMLSAFEPVEPANERMYSAHLTVPFGSRSNASANTFHQGERAGRQLMVQRNLPSGPGFGYRFGVAETNGARTENAELAAQGDRARLRVDTRRSNETTSGHAQLSGSMVASRNGVNLTRAREGSVAVVALPAGQVRVYHDERLAAVTDGGGIAVVPGLRPYESNRLRIEIDDLPLDADIAVSDIQLTPGRRQAVAARFTVTRLQRVVARLQREGANTSVPAGATLVIAGEEEVFPVGHDGLVYLPLPATRPLHLTASWPGGMCRAEIHTAESDQAIVDAGFVPCRE